MAKTPKYLTFEDRQKIEAWYLNGDRPCDIAARLGVHTATVYNDLQRGRTGDLDKNKRLAYSAEVAQTAAQEGLRRRGRPRTTTQLRHLSTPSQSGYIHYCQNSWAQKH